MGKSTLLKIMAGKEEVSNGDARLTPGYSVGLLEQEPGEDGCIDIDTEAIAQAIAERARKDKYGEFSPEDLLWVVQGELEYGEQAE